jgi:hypothetical protein
VVESGEFPTPLEGELGYVTFETVTIKRKWGSSVTNTVLVKILSSYVVSIHWDYNGIRVPETIFNNDLTSSSELH